MAIRGKVTLQAAVLGLVVVAAAIGAVLFFPTFSSWWAGESRDTAPGGPDRTNSYDLVRDAAGKPVKPYRIFLSPLVIQGLKVTSEPVRRAGNLTLPAQVGTLGYDTDRLYSVRPRFQGEVIQMTPVKEFVRTAGSSGGEWKTRLVGPGDSVKKGDVLAVVWSKELGDRKVALISALLDLYLDQELMQRQEPAYLRGSLPEATWRATVSKVEKDLSTVFAAEAGLGIARLTLAEIDEIHNEAKAIQKRLKGKAETPEQRKQRLSADVKKWARVEVLAPQTGVLVEKNTNVNDMVDPSKDTPLFRIADLSTLLINMNFNEEYLPLLQPLMQRLGGQGQLRWKIRIEAEPDIPLLDLPVLRIAPSLDPNNHTALVIGRISNPIKNTRLEDKHLIVGQFVTATVEVPPAPNLVEIPTNALNEVNGESLVIVRPNPDRHEYALRRIAVVRRSKEVTQVRSKLTPQDEAFSEEEVRQGRRPIETLRVGDLVVTRGVTEITDAFDGLLAIVRATK
jgi:cobalt-zinc-cadmium efflux system membrane fusion protein